MDRISVTRPSPGVPLDRRWPSENPTLPSEVLSPCAWTRKPNVRRCQPHVMHSMPRTFVAAWSPSSEFLRRPYPPCRTSQLSSSGSPSRCPCQRNMQRERSVSFRKGQPGRHRRQLQMIQPAPWPIAQQWRGCTEEPIAGPLCTAS